MDKDLKKQVNRAIKLGFSADYHTGHNQVILCCTCGEKCKTVWSTAKEAGGWAKGLRKWIDNHKGHVK